MSHLQNNYIIFIVNPTYFGNDSLNDVFNSQINSKLFAKRTNLYSLFILDFNLRIFWFFYKKYSVFSQYINTGVGQAQIGWSERRAYIGRNIAAGWTKNTNFSDTDIILFWLFHASCQSDVYCAMQQANFYKGPIAQLVRAEDS